MAKVHEINRVAFVADRLVIVIDGNEHAFDLTDISPRLLAASERERLHFEVSASGYGIHWPSVDEDLSIDALLGVVHERSAFVAGRNQERSPVSGTPPRR